MCSSAARFFVEDLVANILAFRLVVLFGESGSGKSSLINAGLIPALAKKAGASSDSGLVRVRDTPIVVERTPIGENASGGFLLLIFDGLAAGENEPTISRSARGKPRGLSNWRPLVGASWSSISSRSCSHGWRDATIWCGGVSQADILEWIVSLLKDASSRAKIVISLREDYLAKLEELAKGYPAVFHHRLRLQNLDRAAARLAIIGPFGADRAASVKTSRPG